MSWMKRPPGPAAPPPAPDQPQPFVQPYGTQPNMYPGYPSVEPSSTQPQQYWQPQPAQLQQQQPQQQQPQPQQQPQYNQQYAQSYQQGYSNNANQVYQQSTQYNQNFSNPSYGNTQQGYQQNFYQGQGAQQNYSQSKGNTDCWEDNWDWGWEDSSKQSQKMVPQNPPQSQAPPTQQQSIKNANVLDESFAPTNTWNWAMENKVETKEPLQIKQDVANQVLPIETPLRNNQNNPESDINTQRSVSNVSAQHPVGEVRTLSDRDVVKERLPNLAVGKRFHLDNLTPQWSIESQMSQESSDGQHTHSESTYRSENQSRNSNKSSPGLNTENSNFNYSQSRLDEIHTQNSEWSQISNDEPSLVENLHSHNSLGEIHDELSHNLQEMTITNCENPTPNTECSAASDLKNISENIPANIPPPLSYSPAHLSASVSSGLPVSSSSPSLQMVPPPPVSLMSNLPPVSSSSAPLLPPSSMAAVLPPPANFPSSSQNPFKLAGQFAHKTVAKPPSAVVPPNQSFPTQINTTNLVSPGVVNKVSQHNRAPVGFGANLETAPDNSERPDPPQMSAFRPVMPVAQQMPENLEIAPKNDRNQYLQTAHLSSGDYEDNTDFSRNAPPPGLQRMVLGQQESEYNQSLNISGDEPPPGLARMVPGQQTETNSGYNQPSDNYMERHVDGQPTDGTGRPYRQADGQQTLDSYAQQPPNRGPERRPIGLDRMVPGEPSNVEYSQYQSTNYAGGNEQRVVTGVDHDYPIATDAGPSDVREQNVDGSDYTEQPARNPSRNVIGAREASESASPAFNQSPEDQQREVTMEGENLQDLSVISSTDASFAREAPLDACNVNLSDVGKDRMTECSDPLEHTIASGSRRQSFNRTNTSGDDSERDRTYKSSPRRDRDKTKSSRDRERDKGDRERDGRYARDDGQYQDRRSKGDKRPEKDRRDRDRERARRDRERAESPDERRHRHGTRSSRYETEDTDYYSDRDRDRDRGRSHRERSYGASKPPRAGERVREWERHGREERARRHRTEEREAQARRGERPRPRDERDERHERHEPRYRDIDTARPRRRARGADERARGGAYSPASRAESREAPPEPPSDEEAERAARRRERRRHRYRDPYYEDAEAVAVAGAGAGAVAGAGAGAGAGLYGDAYTVQQYQYYEHLRLTNPAAYLRVYKLVMAGQPPPPPPDYLAALHQPRHHPHPHPHTHPHTHPNPHTHPHAAGIYAEGYAPPGPGYEARGEERGSGHSGRSSANMLLRTDTYPSYRLERDPLPLRGGREGSLRADLSDRYTELNTDASLNLQLEESLARSERMTPFKYSTAHVKGSIASRDVVVVPPSYPVDGRPATVRLVSLARALPAAELAAWPGPLLRGVSHKKSVIDYCESRGGRAGAAPRDPAGWALLWGLLALLLRQNGVVVGTDLAELLMKNTRDYDQRVLSAAHKPAPAPASASAHGSEWSRRGSARSSSPEPRPRDVSASATASASDMTPQEEPSAALSAPPAAVADAGAGLEAGAGTDAALERLRELLIYGNRHEALEWAMSSGLWGHALQLSAYSERRTRAAVVARFVSSLPAADPLHSLYAALAARQPPAATGVSDERWGDWRPHAAILLANGSAKPEQDQRTLTLLGDSLMSRGLPYCAQFCYLAAGLPPARHPLAPLAPGGAAGAAPAPGAPEPRLSLLLAAPRARSLPALATNAAIFATEIYEYAMSLNRDYVIPELQVYKLVLAVRLADAGLYPRALAYCEAAWRGVRAAPQQAGARLAAALAALGARLRLLEPAPDLAPPDLAPLGPDSADASPDHHYQHHQQQEQQQQQHPHHWVDEAAALADALNAQAQAGGAGSQPTSPQHAQPGAGAGGYYQPQPQQQQQQQQQYSWEQTQGQTYQPPGATYPEPAEDAVDYSQYYQQQQQQQLQQGEAPPSGAEGDALAPAPGPVPAPAAEWSQGNGGESAAPYGEPYWQGDSPYSYTEAQGYAAQAQAQAEGEAEAPRPMITMPGTNTGRGARFSHLDDDEPANGADGPGQGQAGSRETEAPKAGGKRPEGKGEAGARAGRGGWLGGILTKLSLRAPNQMILPDDKNPTIVWDADTKRWRNLDGDEGGAPRALPPPPPAHPAQPAPAPAHPAQPQPQHASSPLQAPPAPAAPPAAPVANIFKMQKGRHIKKSYVDVFNPSGAAPRPLPAPADLLPAPAAPAPAAPAAAQPAYFVPAPAHAQVTLLVSDTPSPAPSPPPSPSPPPHESGVYEPSQAEESGDLYHSGI